MFNIYYFYASYILNIPIIIYIIFLLRKEIPDNIFVLCLSLLYSVVYLLSPISFVLNFMSIVFYHISKFLRV